MPSASLSRVHSVHRKVAALLISALVLAAPVAAQPALAATARDEEFHAMVNATREGLDRRPLKLSEHLSDVARKHSRQMAQRGSLFHSDLGRLLSYGTSSAGENVGYGDSLEQLHNMFMNSSAHKQNILGKRWEKTGVGVVERGGWLWITQIFVG